MKKDYNYIAALEKAIAEKYGKDAVQDFRSMWTPEKEKDYLSDLKEKYDKEKTSKNEVFEVRGVEIRINSIATRKERTCPVCKTYSLRF